MKLRQRGVHENRSTGRKTAITGIRQRSLVTHLFIVNTAGRRRISEMLQVSSNVDTKLYLCQLLCCNTAWIPCSDCVKSSAWAWWAHPPVHVSANPLLCSSAWEGWTHPCACQHQPTAPTPIMSVVSTRLCMSAPAHCSNSVHERGELTLVHVSTNPLLQLRAWAWWAHACACQHQPTAPTPWVATYTILKTSDHSGPTVGVDEIMHSQISTVFNPFCVKALFHRLLQLVHWDRLSLK